MRSLPLVASSGARLFAVALVALALAGCDETAPSPVAPGSVPGAVTGVECRPKSGKVALSWSASDAAYAYRIERRETGAAPLAVGQATAEAFTDYAVTAGVAYTYTVTPIGVDGEGPASEPCAVGATAAEGPDAPQGLVCRAKDGKIDVAWSAAPGAFAYRVFRTGAGEARSQIAETTGLAHADFALQNGFEYAYEVVAIDRRGGASEPSALCTATPGPRPSGQAPPVVADLACRGKNDKVDLTFTRAAGAAFTRIYRSESGGLATPIGETTGGAFVVFGLAIGTSYEFSVESVAAGGAASPRSAACAVTAAGRGTGPANQPPRITSQPLTSALEDHLYYYAVVGADPENAPLRYALRAGPPGMSIGEDSGLVTWSPSASQIGSHAVEVAVADPAGALATQAYVVTAADWNAPPEITSIPGRYARAGTAYAYDVQAFDPENATLAFVLGAGAPAGMSIDPASGVVSWTPEATDAGSALVEVRAFDPAGAFAVQRFALDVTAEPLDLVAPTGDRVLRPGETLRLRLVANYPRVGFRVTPAPENSTLEDGEFTFTPALDQEGVHDLGFEAVLGTERDMNPVRIVVERENRPPVLEPIATQEVDEGGVLRVALSAIDPDGDAVRIMAPGLAIPNAVLNELTNTFEFTPGFDQAGSYAVAITASDSRETVAGELLVTVREAEPPLTDLDLVVDPPQTPTFRDRQTLTGSIRGEGAAAARAPEPLVVGLSPVSVRQGRRVTVEVTGRDTTFAAGTTSADFGAGIDVESVEVLSPTAARVTLVAASDAALGLRGVRMSQPAGDAPSVVAFTVEKGAAVVSGVLIDSFTGQPIVGARISVQGSLATAVSGADGRFALEGVDAGEARVIVTAPNYSVASLAIAVDANQSLDLGEAVEVDALARPFSAGGTLPREAALPSLLDRGFSTKNGEDLTPDAARALVEDALLAIGGREAGLLDEARNQRNPNLVGAGFVSLTPEGVAAFAELLLRGDTWTLAEIHAMLDGTFAWVYDDGFSFEAMRESLQAAVLRAWANPADPQSLLPILLFNEGRTLDSKAPIVTGETRLNHLQTFLLATSFLHTNATVLSNAVDARLVELGIDPDLALEQYGFAPGSLAGGGRAASPFEGLRQTVELGVRLVLARLAPDAAFAADPPGTAPPNSVNTRPPKSRFDALFGAIAPGARAALISGLVAILLVSLIGVLAALGTSLFGGAVSFAFVGTLGAAFGGAFVSQFLSKLLIAFLADPNAAANLTPTPAQVVDQRRFTAASGQQKVAIVFERSATDVAAEQKVLDGETYEGLFRDVRNFVGGSADPQFLDYRYHLWKFPNGADPASYGPGSGAKLISTRSQPVPRDPANPSQAVDPRYLQFVIDNSDENVTPGRNYYRVVTIQFYRRLHTADPDVGPDGLGPRDRREMDEAYKVAYADVFGPEALAEESSASIARGELYENGGDLFGKASTALGETGLREVIERRRDAIAGLKTRLDAGKAEVRAAQAGFADTAVASSMRAKAVDDEILKLERELATLRSELATIALETRPGGLAAHRKIALALSVHLDDPANAGKSASQIFDEFTSPFREPGRSLAAEFQHGGEAGAARLRQVIEIAKNQRAAEEILGRGSRSLLAVQNATDELESALARAQAGGAPVVLPSSSVEIWTPRGSGPVTLDGAPRTIALPTEIGPGDEALVRDLRAQLKAEAAVLETATDELGRNVKALDPLLDAALDEMRFVYMGVGPENVASLREEIFRKKAVLKSARVEQRAVLDQETKRLANAEVVAPKDLTAPGKPAAVRVEVPGGTTAKVIEKQALVERPFASVKAPYAKFATELFGPALDLGTDAWQARDVITVLRSTPSGVIHVEKRADGSVVVGQRSVAPGSQARRLVATQPRLLGPALPEGVEDEGGLLLPMPALARHGFGRAFGAGPEVFFDSGEPVPRSPLDALRFARRAEALRRLGALVRVVQFQGPGGFPLPFESDPDPRNDLGILRPSEPQGPTGKGGFLIRDFPFTDADPVLIDAGFPSDLVAVDSTGAVYLENANSNLQFGGRVFRYAGDPVAREHMGSVSYYSLDLQYGRPVQPRAMEIAEAHTAEYGKVEDLFVAELDPGFYFNTQIQATNRIHRLPIHQATRLAFYANGQNRNRLVAQPYAEHPDFQMTGPSDLERDTIARSLDPAVPKLLFFSDEENVFAISDANKDGQGEVAKLLSVPGRRFSGLAVDANGHLFVADHTSGEVHLVPSDVIDSVLASGDPISSREALDERGFLIKVGIDGPGDLELDTWQQRYLVATLDGIVAFDVPTVGRLGDDVREIHVDVIGREVPVTRRPDRGDVFIAGISSEGRYGKTVRLRVRRADATSGATSWTTSTFATMPFGASIVAGEL